MFILVLFFFPLAPNGSWKGNHNKNTSCFWHFLAISNYTWKSSFYGMKTKTNGPILRRQTYLKAYPWKWEKLNFPPIDFRRFWRLFWRFLKIWSCFSKVFGSFFFPQNIPRCLALLLGPLAAFAQQQAPRTNLQRKGPEFRTMKSKAHLLLFFW